MTEPTMIMYTCSLCRKETALKDMENGRWMLVTSRICVECAKEHIPQFKIVEDTDADNPNQTPAEDLEEPS